MKYDNDNEKMKNLNTQLKNLNVVHSKSHWLGTIAVASLGKY